ncbi:MAG: hypothetical protein SCARUB_04823 [Candidatus Scalindua rubra]|uniref:Uncharacterized protein n=1 Tax=Candidatus Scalindua rubra TaxID=1872076 RepID=A0A1E3X342_9BACT|nr:MAG: hypothetical protein SCARUB_04823 [Candidatus Scalindua rubra]
MKMNKIKSVTLIIVLSTISLFAQEKAITESGKTVLLKEDGSWEYVIDSNENKTKEFDFRKTKWGDSVEKVKSSETATIVPEINDPNILGFTGSVAGLEGLIGYYFVNGKLWKGAYIFSETHSNRNMFITDYSSIKNILIEKYGEPIEDNVNWLNDLYADDTSQYGFAVSLGHLNFYCSWEIGDTKIQMVLSGENYDISHRLEYHNESLKKLAIEEQKKASKSDF